MDPLLVLAGRALLWSGLAASCRVSAMGAIAHGSAFGLAAAAMVSSARRPRLRRRDAGDLLDRSRDSAERTLKSGRSISASSRPATQKRCMCVKSAEQAKHGDDLELQLVGFVGHALGERMQPKEQDTDGQHRDDQKHGHHGHQNIGLAGPGDEPGQVMDRGRMLFCRHLGLQRVDPREPNKTGPRLRTLRFVNFWAAVPAAPLLSGKFQSWNNVYATARRTSPRNTPTMPKATTPRALRRR